VHHLTVALIVFACVFGSALLGLYVRTRLPDHHLSDDSIGGVKLSTGLIATMAALVLGLLISSAKSSFDTLNSEITHEAANIILLDRVLAQYGPETQDLRAYLKRSVANGIEIFASHDPARLASLHSPEAYRRSESFQRELEALSPQNDKQRQLLARAIDMSGSVVALRELGLLQSVSTTPTALLVTLVLWLCIIYGAFGLFSWNNATVRIAMFLGALCTSIAIYLILEMNTPLDGVLPVSLDPLREALAVLGR
jgi:hypothetical protein